jgi:RND family efflux transporter MFP subunit
VGRRGATEHTPVGRAAAAWSVLMKRLLLSSCVSIAALASLNGCRKASVPTPTATAVKVATVDVAGSTTANRYSAQIVAATRVDLAFKVGGYVASIAKAPGVDGKPRILQEGDAVRRNMELASLRRTDYAQKLSEALAALAQARAAAEQTRIDFERSSKLFENGSVSQAELDTTRLRHESADASLAGAKVRVEEAQTALADTSLRSPIDGIIVRRSLEEGALAAPGTVGFSVAETNTVKAVFGVPDTVLPHVQLGAMQAVTTEAYPDKRFEGRITRIAPTADVKGRVFEVEITIPNASQRLKPGMVAALSLTRTAGAGGKEQPLVPLAAIVRSPAHANQFAVFVVSNAADGHPRVQSKEVELGEYLGSVIPVRAGLQGGEQIVVQGAGLLSDGESVEIIP